VLAEEDTSYQQYFKSHIPGHQINWNDAVSRIYQLALPANDRANQRMVHSERRNDSIVHVGEVVRIERQSGHSADVDVKGSQLAKRRSPSFVDQKMLPRSVPALECDSGRRVDHDCETLVADSPGGQAEYDVG